jgi:peptidyl-prolyl cis-trans isomerase D
MAMMIVKFHKLIQSKVLWYIVLGVIVVSFVGFFSPSVGKQASSAPEKVMGSLYGKDVGAKEFRAAYSNMRLMYILSTGREPEVTDAFIDQIWVQLAVLRKAADEKMVVGDAEVIQQIQRLPLFQGQNGVFDQNAYRVIVGRLGASSKQIETMVREQIAVQKMISRSTQAALISPAELKRVYHLYTDKVVLDYAVLSREDMEKTVSVSLEEAQAAFAENMEAFRIPAKVGVSYVEFPVSDFIVDAEVAEGAALEIYNQNIDAYRVENEDESAPVEYKPFESVEGEINGTLLGTAARNLAIEKATSFVAAVAPKAQGEKPNFKGEAELAGLTVKTVPKFGPSDDVEGVDPTAPFKNAALGLQADDYSSFSDAVVGRDNVYVISLDKRFDSFLPEFSVVEDDAMGFARAQAANDALIARIDEIEVAVQAALEKGLGFKMIMKSLGLTVETTEEFDLSSEMESEYSEVFLRVAATVPQGKLCQTVPVQQGALISYVSQRTTQDSEAGLPFLRDELIRGLSGARTQRLVADWQAALLEDADFQMAD